MGNAARFSASLLLALVLAASDLHAAWVPNGAPIGAEMYDQRSVKAVADGDGGAIMIWRDYRSAAPGTGIYVQKVDGWGNVRWALNGVPLRAGFIGYGYPEIVTDGAGGAIAVWSDNRSGGYDIFAQRIDAAGAAQWTTGGVTICASATDQTNVEVIPDGAGGAIIAWEDPRAGSGDIYAQRIGAGGAVQWTANGVAICTNTFEQNEPCLATDGLGGAIVAWDDHRGGPSDIYAQRIGAGGAVAWTANGKVLCNAVNAQQSQCIVSDDAGGAIIAWADYRNSADWLLYAQRIDPSGSIPWTANGVLVSTTVSDIYRPAIVSDGGNGAIITWAQTVPLEQDIYAQRISYLGYRAWNAGGVVVCAATGVQDYPVIVADGHQGAVIAWQDYRPGTTRDIYAQRLTSTGAVDWYTNGVVACGEAGDQVRAGIAADGAGGAIIAWEDFRNGSSADVYAQRLEGNGYWGYPAPTITSVLDVPSDQGGQVTVAWNKSRLETIMAVVIDRYSVWRRLPATQFAALLASGAPGVDPAALAGAAAGPVYYVSTASGVATGWELLEYVDATNAPSYSAQVATLFDATAEDPGLHYFMVMAHGPDHFTFWESQPDSGCSIDNIAPAPPADFSAQQSFDPHGLLLTWGSGTAKARVDEDFSHYALHRGVSADFTPGPGNCIYSGQNTAYCDGEWRLDSGFSYKLSAVDVHGNASTYGLITPGDLTDVETPTAPAATYLGQNVPNPFNPSTTIRFGLAAQGHVTLSIYDALGRLVRTLVDEPRGAGLYRETWDGRDSGGGAVASGVYFCRLRAGTFAEPRKMVLTR